MLLDADVFLLHNDFNAKFLRVGNDIYITEPGDTSMLHMELAEQDKLLDKIETLQQLSKENVDGGMIYVRGKMIRVGGASSSLGLPITSKARGVTLKNLQTKFSSFNIKELSDL